LSARLASVRPPSGSCRANLTAVPGLQTAPVALPAEIDVSNGSLAEAALTRALTDRQTVLAADGSGATFCNCAGVTALIGAHHEAAATGAQLPGGDSQRCADDECLADGVDTDHGYPGPARQLVTQQRSAAAMSCSMLTVSVTPAPPVQAAEQEVRLGRPLNLAGLSLVSQSEGEVTDAS
jgi:hypothetical protein